MACGSQEQRVDRDFVLPAVVSTWPVGAGPTVAIDEAHHNYHTATGRYAPFAELLRRDGFRVVRSDRVFAGPMLEGVDVLVVANAVHESNVDPHGWALPYPPAFQDDEVRAVRA